MKTRGRRGSDEPGSGSVSSSPTPRTVKGRGRKGPTPTKRRRRDGDEDYPSVGKESSPVEEVAPPVEKEVAAEKDSVAEKESATEEASAAEEESVVEKESESPAEKEPPETINSSMSGDDSTDKDTDSDSTSSSEIGDLPQQTSPTSSQEKLGEESSLEAKKKLRRCTLLIDERDQCVYYPSSGAGGQVLAMNGIPVIEGHTVDQGYVFSFQKSNGKNENDTKRFRMKIFTPMLADSKLLISKIKAAHDTSGQKWLFIKDIDMGDKRANLGLLIYEMCETYLAFGPENKFVIECATSLGFYKEDYYLVSPTVQFDLRTMTRLSNEQCILVSDYKADSILFAMNEDTKLLESSAAQKEVNVEMLRYFDPCQLLVSRAATLLAFITPHLRESKQLMSLPVFICYGPNNSGKTDRMIVYSACCGVRGGKNKKTTGKGAVAMMGESSLTFIPLDDPEPKCAKEVIEKGYDGSDIGKLQGNQTTILKIRRNCFVTCKVVDFDQNFHTKVTFCPERPIERERLEANRDLKMTVERLAVTHGPDAVLHNLKYAKLVGTDFRNAILPFYPDAVSIIPEVVGGEFSRWTNNHALLLMGIKLVIDNEDEWGVRYEDVLEYLKASYPKMVSNLSCYGTKIPNLGGGERRDVSLYINKLVEYLKTSSKGNLKQFLRLTVASRPPLPVLGIKKAILDKAGLPDFASVLREGGFQAMDSKNTRFLHEHSDRNYFVISNPPVGKACETTALLVPSEDLAFKPLVDMLKEQEKKDGVTTTGKPIVEPIQNEGGEMCEKCDSVGNELWVCPGCKLTVYCSSDCQQRDYKTHALRCKRIKEAQKAEKKKGKNKGKKTKK